MTISNQNKNNSLVSTNNQKIIETNKKMDIKIIEVKINTYLRKEFERYIYTVGSDYAMNFYSIKRKRELFEGMTTKLFQNIFNNMNKTDEDIIYKNAVIEIYNKNYYKILEDVKKEQRYNEEYEFFKACEEVEVQQISKKEKNSVDIALEVIKVILIVIFLPIVFFIAVLWGACKHNKKSF